MSSREAIVDEVELIGQMLALTSHFQEISNSYGLNDEIDDNDFILCTLGVKELTEYRRKIMQQMMDRYEESDPKYRCIVKHTIMFRELSNELLQSNFDNKTYQDTQLYATGLLNKVLSKFVGLESIVTCGRCFNDMIKELKNKTIDG